MFEKWPFASEMMTPNPITVESEETLSTALGLLRSHGIHELPVVTGGKLTGLFQYDSLGRRHNLSLSTKVGNLMSVPPTVAPRAMLPEVAERVLDAEMRAACVVDPREGRLVGIVSSTDMVKAVARVPKISEHPARSIANPVSLVFRENDSCTTLFPSLKILEAHLAPVINSKMKLVGAVGIGEVGDALWRPSAKGHRDIGNTQSAAGTSIGSIMRPLPPTVGQNATVEEVVKLMARHSSFSVFVVERERPLGVISHSDVLSLVVRQRRPEESAYVQVTGLGPTTDPYILTDLDRVIGKSLKRIAHLERPTMFSLHVTQHASRRLADVTLQGRLYTESGQSFHATRTDWNLLTSVAGLMSDLERLVKERRDLAKERVRRTPRSLFTSTSSQLLGQDDLDQRLRSSLGGNDGRASKRRRVRT